MTLNRGQRFMRCYPFFVKARCGLFSVRPLPGRPPNRESAIITLAPWCWTFDSARALERLFVEELLRWTPTTTLVVDLRAEPNDRIFICCDEAVGIAIFGRVMQQEQHRTVDCFLGVNPFVGLLAHLSSTSCLRCSRIPFCSPALENSAQTAARAMICRRGSFPSR